jgi:hypothetical protein
MKPAARGTDPWGIALILSPLPHYVFGLPPIGAFLTGLVGVCVLAG